MRRAVVSFVFAIMVWSLAVSAGATTLVQPFEDETWDEDPDLSMEENIDALREVHPYLADVRGLDMIRTQRGHGFMNHGLEIGIPSGGFRGFGPYARLAQPVDEAWFRYYLFLDDFRPVSSGKLPGLADASLTPNAKGCKPSTESAPGWSARLMFDTMGTAGAGPTEVPIGYYLYHLGQEGDCGDELMFDTALAQQRWTCIEGHVRMNTPGATDGMIQAWVDGRRVFHQDGLEFRRPGESVSVREMWNNVYFGGRYPTPHQLDLVLDEVVVRDTGRIGCLDPFLDDNDSVHAGDLAELHARRLFFGCGQRLACPYDGLTRAEFAAMTHRVMGIPPGPDAFSDDDGHWGEGAIDSLARAGVLRGCNPPANTMVCPDKQITRGEVAAVVTRMLNLTRGPDAFSDDDGHWAEGDINALAQAGITRGCGGGSYCPGRSMTRGEAATFTLRIDDRVREVETLRAPSLPDWPPAGPPPVKPPEERE